MQRGLNEPWRREDFDSGPMVVFYEVTRACDLLCRHCRADAQREADPAELSGRDAKRLIRQLNEFPRPPLLVLTGGDPLKRSTAGNCGVCEFRRICGGSRARAFAVGGDPLAAEPDCAYVPPG